MRSTSTSWPRNELRRNATWVFPVLLSCLIAVALTIGRSSSNERPPVGESSDQRTAQAADVYEEDAEFLQTEFPGYVLPLERVQLAELLTDAIESNDDAEVLRLLDLGAGADWSGPEFSNRSDTRAPLFRAIRQGNPRTVESLLQRGARAGGPTSDQMIASRNQFSQTPLYFAVRCRNREVVDVLLKYGALINATNGYGKLPIVGAVEESDLEMFEHLLSRGAVWDFESTFGRDHISSTSVLHEHPDEFFVPPLVDKCSVSVSLSGLAQRSGNARLIAAVREQFLRSPAFRPDLQAEVAVRMNDASTLHRMIADGYDPSEDQPHFPNSGTLLDLAVAFNRANCFELLQRSGVKQTRAIEKHSTLHLLVVSGNVEKLK